LSTSARSATPDQKIAPSKIVGVPQGHWDPNVLHGVRFLLHVIGHVDEPLTKPIDLLPSAPRPTLRGCASGTGGADQLFVYVPSRWLMRLHRSGPLRLMRDSGYAWSPVFAALYSLSRAARSRALHPYVSGR
jgi:hypothetical protein